MSRDPDIYSRISRHLSPMEEAILQSMVQDEQSEAEEAGTNIEGFIRRVVRAKLQIYSHLLTHIFGSLSTENVKLAVKALGVADEELAKQSQVYGDIDFHSFSNILVRTKPQPAETFVDLGTLLY